MLHKILRASWARWGLLATAGLAMLAFTAAPKGLARADQEEAKKPEKKEVKSDGPRHVSRQDESGPLVFNWKFTPDEVLRLGCPHHGGAVRKCSAEANLTLNRDGSWNLSGKLNWSDRNSHLDLSLSVKNSEGTLITFTASAPSTALGYVLDKQGNNRTIKDNWKAFAKGCDVDWSAAFVRPD
jgi:hypothetical protein